MEYIEEPEWIDEVLIIGRLPPESARNVPLPGIRYATYRLMNVAVAAEISLN